VTLGGAADHEVPVAAAVGAHAGRGQKGAQVGQAGRILQVDFHLADFGVAGHRRCCGFTADHQFGQDGGDGGVDGRGVSQGTEGKSRGQRQARRGQTAQRHQPWLSGP